MMQNCKNSKTMAASHQILQNVNCPYADAARRSSAQLGAARRSSAQLGAARRSSAQLGAARRSSAQLGAARRSSITFSVKSSRLNHDDPRSGSSSIETLKFASVMPGSKHGFPLASSTRTTGSSLASSSTCKRLTTWGKPSFALPSVHKALTNFPKLQPCVFHK